MSKRKDGNWMLKWKNKIGVRLSALDKKKLVLTIIPYVITALYANRAYTTQRFKTSIYNTSSFRRTHSLS